MRNALRIGDMTYNAPIDRGTGTGAFAPTKGIHCNKDGYYNLTFAGLSAAIPMFLVAGNAYQGYSVTNILTSGDAALSAGDITLLY